MMDEDYEGKAISSRSTTEDDLSGDEEVTFKKRSASKKYQRRERFLSGRDFFHLPFLRAFATGPSPAVEDREEPRAYFIVASAGPTYQRKNLFKDTRKSCLGALQTR